MASLLISNKPIAVAKDEKKNTPYVKTMMLIPQNIKASISSQGVISPSSSITLISELNSKVDWISSKMQTGSSFQKNDTLLILDKRDYELALITAESNVLNAGVTLPAPSSVTGLQWSDVTGTPILLDTTPEIYAKGWTSNGLYQYEATFATPCGTFSDTSDILVLLQTLDTTAITVCDTFTTPMGGVAYTNSGFYTDTTFGTAIVYDSIIHVYDVTVNYMSYMRFNLRAKKKMC